MFVSLALASFFGSAAAHNPLALPYEAVPGYVDCSGANPRDAQHFQPTGNPRCNIPPKTAGTTTISCVGDSITAGGWPQIMQANLNAKYGVGKYSVINFGECGSTMQRNADSPYDKRGSWPRVLNTSSDWIIIMCVATNCSLAGRPDTPTHPGSRRLTHIFYPPPPPCRLGTNDAKTREDNGPANWENVSGCPGATHHRWYTHIHQAPLKTHNPPPPPPPPPPCPQQDGKTGQVEYMADYAWMIETFQALPSKPDVFTTIPVPNYKNGVYGMNQTVINHVFPVILPQIAAADAPKHKPLDIFDCMGGVNLTHPELIADGCHPNAAGYKFLAGCFQAALGL